MKGIHSSIYAAHNLKKKGSKTDLKACIFSTDGKPLFQISQTGNITQQLNEKLYQ